MKSRLRALINAPSFSAVVIIILAFGIGASTAFFSVVDAVLLQPLRIDTAGRIVAIQTAWPEKGRVSPRVSGGDFLDLRSAAHSLAAVSVYSGGELGVQIGTATRFARTFQTDPSFFPVLNIAPSAGTLPGGSNGRADTAVVTTSFALANWGERKVGGTLRVENRLYTVSGIVDDVYAFPEGAEVWITGPPDPENQNHTAMNYRAIARLKPGVSLAQAQADLGRLHEQDRRFRPLSLRDEVAGPARTTLLFLFAATALLLIMACANAANLILARTAQRNREIAIRLSLGSSVRGLFRLIALESLLLATAATTLGIFIAYAALHAIYPLLPASLPRSAEILHMHPAVLVFASLACCFTVVVCSGVPAFYLRRIGIADALKQSAGRGLTGGGQRTRSIVVAAQVALSCVLCVAAVLISRSLIALNNAALGFDPDHITVMYADAPSFQLPDYMRAIQTFETVIHSVERLPATKSAAAIMGLPTGRYGSNGSYWVEGVHIQPGQDLLNTDWSKRVLPYANFSVATPGYFKTVGIPLLAGRDFNDSDRYDLSFTAIVSKALAQRSFGAANPIGHRIYCGLDSPKPMTIVGVVGDVRQDSPASSLEPAIYMPLRQHPYYANEVEVVVRAEGDPHVLIPALRQVMRQQAPSVAIEFTTLADMVHTSTAAPRFRAILSIVFAALAAILAVAGVYAVLLFEVNQQRSEIGLRMALGAAPESIMGLVVRRALGLSSAGLIVGVFTAVTLSRFVKSLVFGVEVLDPFTYCLGAGAVLCAVAVAAAGPTWRASRVDPAVALRTD